MCNPVEEIIDVVEDIVDVVVDVVDAIVDVVEDVISWLIPIPEIPDFDDGGFNDPNQNNDGILVNKQSSSAGLPIIYGFRRTGGTIVFLELDSTNKFLFLVLALCEGQVTVSYTHLTLPTKKRV